MRWYGYAVSRPPLCGAGVAHRSSQSYDDSRSDRVEDDSEVIDLDDLAKQAAAHAVRFEGSARQAWTGFAESLRRSDDA